MQIKAVKFGGTSLATAEQFKKVYDIIKSDESRRYVVASAPGKRYETDTKITDMLYACYDMAVAGLDITYFFSAIKMRFDSIIEGLGIDLDLSGEYAKIRDAMQRLAGRDYAASRGEYLNALILANYLGYDFIDAADVIFFAPDGSFDAERTNITMSSEFKMHERAVIPGFYGSMPNDTISTFSRGGSDITGAIVARAASADLYENWTDVSGVLMADPRIVKNPLEINTVTYRELRELSYMGASVLHEDSIFPVKQAGIPINIRNTNRPEDKGTMIVPDTGKYDKAHVITGIAGKKNFSVVRIEKDKMASQRGMLHSVVEIMDYNGIHIEHIPSGIDSMTLVVNSSELKGRRQKIIESIKRATDPDNVVVEDGLALIAVVGRGMVRVKGVAARVFRAVADAGINVRMIDQGSCELNIIIGVDADDFEAALSAIYSEFVK